MNRKVKAPDTEPEESRFDLPSEKEHLLQIVDVWQDIKDPDVYGMRIESVGGPEEGRSLLHRVNINDSLKSFYYCRLFLKAISEPYKGEFDIVPENWIGRQFYARVIHNGKYANIDEYNFDKTVEQIKTPKSISNESQETAWDE